MAGSPKKRARRAKAEAEAAAGTLDGPDAEARKPDAGGKSAKAAGKDAGTKAERPRRARKAPAVKDYSKTKAYTVMREALQTKACVELGALDPLQIDRIEEIMDLWCQRQMLRDNVHRRGPTVFDERGREVENRCISLGLQVSKQILELYKSLGLVVDPQDKKGAKKTDQSDDWDEEDDEL